MATVDGQKSSAAHRISYRIFVGDIDPGNQVHHRCRVRACCNPEHLEQLSVRDHLLVDDTISKRNTEKTHCHRGHELTPENTYLRGSWRVCKECNKIFQKRHRDKISLSALTV